MGGRKDPGHQVRMLYPVKDNAQFKGLRDHMLGPAKDVAELARRYGVDYAISSGVRMGENSAHGEGFALDWSIPDAFAAPLLAEMNNRWGPKGYHFTWHRNRMGFDKNGEPIFDDENFHFHGQLKQQRYKRILTDEHAASGVDELNRDRARRAFRQQTQGLGQDPEGPAVPPPASPNAPPALTAFRQTPALRSSVKTAHLNERAAVVPPALPLQAQGLIVGDFEKTRAHQAPAIETDRILQGALRDIGRKTLIEGG